MHNDDKCNTGGQSDQNGPFSWPFESRCVIYCCIHQHKNQLVEESKSLHPTTTILLIRKKKKGDSDVATSVNYVVASFSSWFKSRCNSEMGITRITGAPKTIASSWKWTHWMGADKPYGTYLPKGKPLGSHMLNYNVRFTLIPPMWHRW